MNSPPKPHAFVSLQLQSVTFVQVVKMAVYFCVLGAVLIFANEIAVNNPICIKDGNINFSLLKSLAKLVTRAEPSSYGVPLEIVLEAKDEAISTLREVTKSLHSTLSSFSDAYTHTAPTVTITPTETIGIAETVTKTYSFTASPTPTYCYNPSNVSCSELKVVL